MPLGTHQHRCGMVGSDLIVMIRRPVLGSGLKRSTDQVSVDSISDVGAAVNPALRSTIPDVGGVDGSIRTWAAPTVNPCGSVRASRGR